MPDHLSFGPRLFLVSLGSASALDLQDLTRSGCYPARGLLLRGASAAGQPADLFIAAEDLLDFADFHALTILKPTVVPLTVVEVRAGRINATIASDPEAQHIAHQFRAVLTARPKPVTKTGL
ncbi:MAG: hypothetical protein APF80_11890 [Alphaproteobacteria bacterium BRH_c36]|nr:MAG: hypothetical protein APF80_11890 [Alphaproteobacteria bacterium BRH_c36]